MTMLFQTPAVHLICEFKNSFALINEAALMLVHAIHKFLSSFNVDS